jgi:DNA-binding NtrC family response regulator
MEKTKVLVIEDDAAVRQVVCLVLTEFGRYEPTGAADGREGIEALRHDRFGLVITDVLMPDQDGIETIERIRELDDKIPIIAISGSGTGEFSPLAEASLIGATQTLQKPFGAQELLDAVQDVLGDAGHA